MTDFAYKRKKDRYSGILRAVRSTVVDIECQGKLPPLNSIVYIGPNGKTNVKIILT